MAIGIALGHFVITDPEAFFAPMTVGTTNLPIALGLILMTAVIQLFVYPDAWPDHILWFAALLLILARGPGAISLDHLIWNKMQPATAAAR